MRAVSYTRSTSCYPGTDDIPATVIKEQNEHIRDYIKRNHWKLRETYSDRKQDKSANAAFEEMLRDGMQRKFDVVVVDSIFRAGKDLWNAKEVLLQTFYYAGIGFAVVEDDFNSQEKTKEQVEAYFAEKYREFRKENIQHQVKERTRNGKLCWSDEVYGYKCSEDQLSLLIDEAAAPVVKRIFMSYIDGESPAMIAKSLREEYIMTPKAVKGTKAIIKDPYHWSTLTITRILGKTVYAGYWTKTVHGVTHEHKCQPIIEPELFHRAQEILKAQQLSSERKKPSQRHRYAGLVCDSKDGFNLHARTVKNGEPRFSFERKREGCEAGKYILFSEVDKAVRERMNREKQKAERINKKMNEDGHLWKKCLLDGLNDDIRRHAMLIVEQERKRMEESRDEAGSYGNSSQVITTAEPVFQNYPVKVKKIEIAYSENNPWLRLMLSWNEELPLTKEVLNQYISRIVIDQLTTISVIPKEQEWLEELPLEWRG